MTQLSVNLNKVALVRNARGGGRPDLLHLAAACLRGGASGLTLHPRPDGRHARAADVAALAGWLPRQPGGPYELNVEGNPFEGPGTTGDYAYPGFLALVREGRPAQATLVPDTPGQLTSDHGWGPDHDPARLRQCVAELHTLGCRVSVFVDASPEAVRAAAAAGADRVELFTGPYADAYADGTADRVLPAFQAAAAAAHEAGLGLNAGHDLDLDNLGTFLRAVPGVDEVSIGQALVADALDQGMEAAVRAYVGVIRAV